MAKETITSGNEKPIEKQHLGRLDVSLWKAADKLRKNIDAAEYKHIVLGLILLVAPPALGKVMGPAGQNRY